MEESESVRSNSITCERISKSHNDDGGSNDSDDDDDDNDEISRSDNGSIS